MARAGSDGIASRIKPLGCRHRLGPLELTHVGLQVADDPEQKLVTSPPPNATVRASQH